MGTMCLSRGLKYCRRFLQLGGLRAGSSDWTRKVWILIVSLRLLFTVIELRG